MKVNVTITEKEFKNKFEKVLLNNPTIHTILSKESNLGFMTRLVTDQLKAELTESIFAEDNAIAEEDDLETNETEENVSTTEESSEETEPVEDDSTEDGLDDLDELD